MKSLEVSHGTVLIDIWTKRAPDMGGLNYSLTFNNKHTKYSISLTREDMELLADRIKEELNDKT